MAHLVFRCDHTSRIIMTGIEMRPEVFNSLSTGRTMRCRFCGQDHAWEIVEHMPAAAVLMSIKAEDLLARSVQSDVYASETNDPDIREMHERLSAQWYQLALEHEAKAAALE